MWIGALITAFWLSLLCGFLIASRTALLSMKPNELGDMLAGSFSPLAFAWVVVAVFLQHRELEAQRRELHDHGEILKTQAEQMRQSVEKLQSQSEQMQLAYMQREQDRIAQVLRDLLRRLVHVMYIVAELTASASLRDERDSSQGDGRAVFRESAFYLECGNRDEFDIATADFVRRLEALANALEDPDQILDWQEPEMEAFRAYLVAIQNRLLLIRDLGEKAHEDDKSIYLLPDFVRLQSVLDGIIPQLGKWVSPSAV